ncbi:MAG: hypothetical protein KDK66_03595 [Deltaproteobacteria bacterium]|nr:hypothetical protein [Deltaproteobacteria bacterium]
MKILLMLLNMGTLVLFTFALLTGIHISQGGTVIPGMGAHLGWILGTFLLWMFTQILALLYMYRMEKFCVEVVNKYEDGKPVLKNDLTTDKQQ